VRPVAGSTADTRFDWLWAAAAVASSAADGTGGGIARGAAATAGGSGNGASDWLGTAFPVIEASSALGLIQLVNCVNVLK